RNAGGGVAQNSWQAIASSPALWRWPPLLLRGFEVGVRAAVMVGHIHHARDLRHGLDDGPLDPLAERDGGHRAALTAATQPEVGGSLLDRHELGAAAVRGDRRVHLPVKHLDHALG